MINSFFFNYNSRIIQEYFQAKIGRKIRIFSLARKKQHFYMKKECIIKMGRFYPNGDPTRCSFRYKRLTGVVSFSTSCRLG